MKLMRRDNVDYFVLEKCYMYTLFLGHHANTHPSIIGWGVDEIIVDFDEVDEEGCCWLFRVGEMLYVYLIF